MLAPTAMCRRSIEPSSTAPPPCRPPSFRCAIGTPQRRCNPPPFATTYRDIAPGVTPGHRRGRHEVPPHAAKSTTRGLYPHDAYPRLGRSRHRTSGPRQRAIPAAAAPSVGRDREAPALPRIVIRSTSPTAPFALVPTLGPLEVANRSSCPDRAVTGRHRWRRGVREPGSVAQPYMTPSATAGAGEIGSCFALSSDVQWQGWSPATPARTGPDIGTSAQFASPPKPLPL